jgi:hypothetical protein
MRAWCSSSRIDPDVASRRSPHPTPLRDVDLSRKRERLGVHAS